MSDNEFYELEKRINKLILLYEMNMNEYDDGTLNSIVENLNKLIKQIDIDFNLDILTCNDYKYIDNLLISLENKVDTKINLEKTIKLYEKKQTNLEKKVNFLLTIKYVLLPSIVIFIILYFSK